VEETRPRPIVSLADARAYIAAKALVPSRTRCVGLEIELFVLDPAAPERIPSPEELRTALGAVGRDAGLPAGAQLTFEPGGQLELSGAPASGAPAAIAAIRADLEAVRTRLARAGLEVHGGGIERWREPYRWVHGVRYDAMADHFEACGPTIQAAGAVMMTATAALQVNVEAGTDPADVAARWRQAHAVAPVLAAMFASSPVLSGRVTDLASARLGAWLELDPCRTRPVYGEDGDPGADPGVQWAQYALDASVFFVPDPAGGHGAPGLFTLAEWIADPGRAGRPVTTADVDYHLTTLFPPLRPRGFVEIRYLDGQELDLWPVAAAVVAAIHDEAATLAAAAEVCVGLGNLWAEAAGSGVADVRLGPAARDLIGIAAQALAQASAPTDLLDAVAAFADRYPMQGRCPADDVLASARDVLVRAS